MKNRSLAASAFGFFWRFSFGARFSGLGQLVSKNNRLWRWLLILLVQAVAQPPCLPMVQAGMEWAHNSLLKARPNLYGNGGNLAFSGLTFRF